MYCVANDHGICAICDYRRYMRGRGKEYLRAVCRARNLAITNDMNGGRLLGLIRADDNAAGDVLAPSEHANYRVTDEQLSQIQIGIEWSTIAHIRRRASANWSRCEELRFQFSVATTLVHEIVHAFWPYVHRRCWDCFDDDPWISKDEKKKGLEKEAELGYSWEYFAFGSRTPTGRRSCRRGDKGLPNELHQCQWSYFQATLEAERGEHPLINHDFILPVPYIHDWFQESTWKRTATDGRLEGRPNFDDALIMRQVPVNLDDDESWGDRTCSIE